MCSNKCAKPVRFFGSMRNPIRYITSTITTGAAWFSLMTTRRPFGSVRYMTGTEKVELAERLAGAGGRPCAAGVDTETAARQAASSVWRIRREFTIRVLDEI